MILDPPWPSMSVSRAKSYNTLTLSILEKYLSSINPEIILTDDNGIVGIWITNDPKVKQWVLYIYSFIYKCIGINYFQSGILNIIQHFIGLK